MKVRETAKHVAETVKMVAVKAKDAMIWTAKKIDWAISPGTYFRHFWVPDKKKGRTLRAYLFAGVALGCFAVVGATIVAAAVPTFTVPTAVVYAAGFGQWALFADDHFKEIHAQMPLLFGVCSWAPYVGMVGISGIALKKHGLTLVGSLAAADGLKSADREATKQVLLHSGLSVVRIKTGSHNLVSFFRRMKRTPHDPETPPAAA